MRVEYAQLILAQKHIAYATLDRDMHVLALGGATELLGIDGSARGMPLTDVVPELIGSETEMQAVARHAEPRLLVPRVNRDDPQTGDVIYLDFTLLPNDVDADACLLFVAEDVTALARTEQILTQQRNELTLLREQLTTQNLALATANAELKQLDHLRSRFVTVAAHELRSPLATISGYVDLMLEEDLSGPLTEMQEMSVNTIQRSTGRLLAMVSNLLDLTRIEAGRLELAMQALDAGPMIAQVVREFMPLATEKEHDLAITCPADLPMVLCDPERIAQILHNLLSNAIKYTSPGGRIDLSVTRDSDPNFLCFTVADNGIGIPKEEHDHLFDAFFRASNVYEVSARGSGLGLGIVQSLVMLHGGRVWFESEPSQGSRFSFTMPVVDEPAL